MALIKMDIDDLFREREKIQTALVEGEEVARALLNATSDLSILIKIDGTILSANETFAKRLGRSPASLRNENITNFIDSRLNEYRMIQLKKVVLTGKRVRFEDEDSGRFYDNTIYPVFNADGNVDRLALYTRDISDVKKAEKHIQALTQEIIKAQENERQRIARDLHDNVAQDLASLIISSDTLFEDFPDIPNEVRRRTLKFSRVLKRAISSIRDLAYDLRPPSLDQLGLVRTLSQYCTDFSESNMVSVDFYSAGLDKLDLDFDTEINLYRLIQEALNNIKKHSGANHITIRLVASFPEIILRIEDDGRGFDPEKRIIEALNEKRMGLKSMEERVKLLRGEFTIRSRPGEGTMILVKLPYTHGKETWE
ncbi:MAG: histidine kinase [Desulfobacteraceae bacterium]|nr:histidine kinase [Desulfobacteraceae bacterium]